MQRRLSIAACVPPALLPNKLLPLPLQKKPPAAANGRSTKRAAAEEEDVHRLLEDNKRLRARCKQLTEENERLRAGCNVDSSAPENQPLGSPAQRHLGLV